MPMQDRREAIKQRPLQAMTGLWLLAVILYLAADATGFGELWPAIAVALLVSLWGVYRA